MGETPDQLKRDIEQTRRELTYDVDVLSEKVSPSRVVSRRVERTKGAMSSAKDRVMGSSSSMSDKAGSTASSMSDTLGTGQDKVRQRAEGNPIAAGVIAFASGWLVASVLPATTPEKRAAGAIQEKAQEYSEPAKEQLSQVGRELKDDLQEPAQQAVQNVKDSAAEAAETVKGEGQSAAQTVKDEGADSAQTVRESRRSGEGST